MSTSSVVLAPWLPVQCTVRVDWPLAQADQLPVCHRYEMQAATTQDCSTCRAPRAFHLRLHRSGQPAQP